MATLMSPAFTQKVVSAMRELYPEELADRTWDNVGLLLGNINPSHALSPLKSPGVFQVQVVLLTNDLTLAVAEEAIRKNASVIVTYHPFIFSGFKSITLDDPHQRITLLLSQHNIAVYSPHTAVDAVPYGLNDWLARMVPGHADAGAAISVIKRVPMVFDIPRGFENSGYGRLVKLDKEVVLGDLIQSFALNLGDLPYMSVALPATWPRPCANMSIRSVAVCAGSGYDVLKNADADVLITGEMSHHNALRLTMLGKAVITVFHSNSERAYLGKIMQPKLESILRREFPDAQVLVSQKDADPFEVWEVPGMGPVGEYPVRVPRLLSGGDEEK